MVFEKLSVLGLSARSELITRGTPISIGLAIVILGGVWIFATEVQALKSTVRSNDAQIENVQEKIVPRSELENRLQRLEENQQEILKRLRR